MKTLSTKNTYRTSDGQRLTSSQIKRRVDKSKMKRSYEGVKSCETCNRNDQRLTLSHTISEKYAKEHGMTELCWDKRNMPFECEDCHRATESMSNVDRVERYKNRIL